MKITVGIATHKEYKFPEDKIYIPIHRGKEISDKDIPGCIGDNTGENISAKNKNYCELTALYWLWKNCNSDYLGLCHYRRYFKGSNDKDIYNSILNKEQAEEILKETPVILPKKRDYFIETTYQQYIHAHNKQDLDETLEILTQYYPSYLPAWEKVMNSTKGHRFNMLIMRKDIFDSYCKWLFDVLFKLEDVLDISEYSDNDKRVFGFVSERLLDVWIETNHIPYTELPVVSTEKANWVKKGTAFLKRKLTYKGEK